MVYLPTLTLRINHSWIGKYAVHPMDPTVAHQTALNAQKTK